jgi:hypothetical protein
MKIFYHYESISGTRMPDVKEFDGTREEAILELEKMFEGSMTPVVKILSRVGENTLKAYESWLEGTPETETGLRWNLSYVIEAMKEELAA